MKDLKKRLEQAEGILHALYVFATWILNTQTLSTQKRSYGEACTEEAREYMDKNMKGKV